jgi:hypothetical protein
MLTRDRNVIVTLDDGSEVGFRINNWVLKETQRKAGCKGIIDLLKKIGVDDDNMDTVAFNILIMEAVNEYNHHQGIKTKLDDRGASDLIDQMGGIMQALHKIIEGFDTYVSKNLQPRQEAGETVMSQ